MLASLLTKGLLVAHVLLSAPTETVLQPPSAQGSTHGSHLTVYLVTMGPGDQVWERFGHNAIWIRDDLAGTDVAYNWGLFDFQQENFIRRFLQGEMLYWMGGFDAHAMVAMYRQENRTVVRQELNLPPGQRLALQEFVQWNAQPENRFYRYQYFLDNCSTRARDALDLAMGGVLQSRFGAMASGESWRSVVRRVLEGSIPEYLALDILMAPPTDAPISVWEEMFIPMVLRDRVREVQVEGPGGTPVPLVVAEETLFEADRPDPAGRSRRFIPLLGGLSLLLGGTVAFAGSRSRALLLLVGGGWGLLSGLFGAVMLFFWLGSAHTFAHGNLNLLLMNPLGLLLLLLLPWALFKGETSSPGVQARAWAGRTAALSLVLALGGILLLPAGLQGSGQVALLSLPLHLGVWWGLRNRFSV